MKPRPVQFDGFDWDSGNTRKASRHGLRLEEIEALFTRELLVTEDRRHSVDERRLIAVGRSTKDRPMFVAYTMRRRNGRLLIRVISARYAHARELNAYENLEENPEDS